jgi:hypothetical protein
MMPDILSAWLIVSSVLAALVGLDALRGYIWRER